MGARYKGTKKKSIYINILLAFFIAVATVSAFFLFKDLFYDNYVNDKTLNVIQRELLELAQNDDDFDVSVDDDFTDSETEIIETSYVEAINLLREEYPDLVGWIEIEALDINFPVMQSDISEYYLYKDYTGSYTKYGSIFLDDNSTLDSFNQILHGHAMFDGSMFYPLIDYCDLDVYESAPTITYDTYEESGEWKIISVFKTNTYSSQGDVFSYLISDFSSDESKLEYLYEVMNRSIIDTGVCVNETDELLTLSTCSYEYDGFRTVIVARKVRDDESTEVDTSNAYLRDDVVYPDIWYESTSDTDPNFPDTFEEAYSQGLTSWWYDG